MPDLRPAKSERNVYRDEADIVIVRERRFRYRWTCAVRTGGRKKSAGITWTAWGARRAAMLRLHGWAAGTFMGRVEREEIRVAAQTSTAAFGEDPEMLPTELLDA
jgi:hypothetical protein